MEPAPVIRVTIDNGWGCPEGRPEGRHDREFLSVAETNPLFGIYDDVLSEEFCEDVIRRFESDARKVKGMTGSGAHGVVFFNDTATTEILLWTHSEGWEDVNNAIEQSLKHCLKQYMSRWGRAFPIGVYPEEPRITRYRKGEGFLAWHSDNIGRSPTRVITAIWYLNTVERGGETDYRWQGATVKPKVGRLLLCPVGWPFLHRGNPPESGPKYILITQLHQASPEARHTPHESAESERAQLGA
jgi:hypothetical protein